MSSATRLAQLVDSWAAEVEAFCTEANETLDGLEAHGKEPILDDAWLEDLSSPDESFYFSTDSLESEGEAEREEKHRQLRLNITLAPAAELPSFTSPDSLSDVLELAHAEDVEVWQQEIAIVMASHKRLSFTRLLELSELQPGELLIGLLLSQWKLKQQTFYGEIEVSSV